MRRLIFFKDKSTEQNRSQMRANGFGWSALRLALRRGTTLGLICLASAIWVYRAELITAGYELSAHTGLGLTDIEITGRNYTSPEAIKEAVGASYGDPLLAVSLQEIKHSLEQLGWVKEASVSRIYPNRLAIALTERRPLALLQTTAGHRLIDETGHFIFGAKASSFSHLPVVSGDGAAEEAKVIIEALRTEPDLYADVWAIQRIANRRWDVHLRTGMAVRLPEENAVMAWSKLAILDRDTKIMKRDLATIDLRVSGQLIVEPNLPLSKKGQKT